MVSFPPCKINLGLHIISKRPDGYHTIETCFYPVPWTDILEIVPADDFSFSVTGNAIPGADADNLCVRAYNLFRETFNTGPVAMHLHKCIPSGAGLGGGSADAAYTLTTLASIFNLRPDTARLEGLAAQLGSDCAFFIRARPMIGTGRGEVLSETKTSLKGKFLVIVKPDVQVSTAMAYADVTPRLPATGLRSILENHPVSDWRTLLKNDFEDSVFRQFPVTEALKEKLYASGASYASLSGSGSAVYGIFDAQTDLNCEFEGFTYWSGCLD